MNFFRGLPDRGKASVDSQSREYDLAHVDIALHEACKSADCAGIQRLIDANVNIHCMVGPFGDQEYPLVTAAETGSLEAVHLLLENGARVEINALRNAVTRGDLPMVRLLSEPVKAVILANNKSRWRGDVAGLLMLAIRSGQGRVLKELLVFQSRAAPPVAFLQALNEGLSSAAARGDFESVTTLVHMGATDVQRIFDTAARKAQYDLLKDSIQALRPDKQALEEPLAIVASAGHVPTLGYLLEQGAQDHGKALKRAIRASQRQVINVLLSHFSYSTRALAACLASAATAGDLETMGLLMDMSPDDGPALQSASDSGQACAMRELLTRFSYSSEALSQSLGAAILRWAQRQEENDIWMAEEGGSDRPRLSGTPESSDRVKLLLDRGAKLTMSHFTQLLEVLIVLRHEFAATLLTNPKKYTDEHYMPDKYLLALAISRGCTEETNLLLGMPIFKDSDEIHSAGVVPGNPPAQTSIDGQISSGRLSQPMGRPVPTPLIAAITTQDIPLCERLLQRAGTKEDLQIWCDYRRHSRPTSYYARDPIIKDINFECLRNLFGPIPIRANPLWLALNLRNARLVDLLILHGANPWCSQANHSILGEAAEANLLSHILPPPEHRPTSFFINRIDMVRGRALLHWAAAHDRADFIAALLRAFPDTARVDVLTASSFQTPLYVAVAAGAADAVEQLCWAGADLSIKANGEERGAVEEEAPQKPFEHWRMERKDAVELATRLIGNTGEAVELQQRRERILAFLQTWRERGGVVDAAHIRKDWVEYLKKTQAEAKSRAERGEDIEHFSDEESLHLSDDDDDDDNGKDSNDDDIMKD